MVEKPVILSLRTTSIVRKGEQLDRFEWIEEGERIVGGWLAQACWRMAGKRLMALVMICHTNKMEHIYPELHM